MVNFYRDMWIKRLNVLAPLTRLTSKNAVFKWTDIEQKSFKDIKLIVSRGIHLVYPNLIKSFVIHTDTSKTHLEVVISQEGKHIEFYIRKLSDAQKRYANTQQ